LAAGGGTVSDATGVGAGVAAGVVATAAGATFGAAGAFTPVATFVGAADFTVPMGFERVASVDVGFVCAADSTEVVTVGCTGEVTFTGAFALAFGAGFAFGADFAFGAAFPAAAGTLRAASTNSVNAFTRAVFTPDVFGVAGFDSLFGGSAGVGGTDALRGGGRRGMRAHSRGGTGDGRVDRVVDSAPRHRATLNACASEDASARWSARERISTPEVIHQPSSLVKPLQPLETAVYLAS
jgi:hypothetical protein